MLVGFSLGLKDNTRIKREKERRKTKRMKCFGLEEEVLEPIDLIELPTSCVVWCGVSVRELALKVHLYSKWVYKEGLHGCTLFLSFLALCLLILVYIHTHVTAFIPLTLRP